MATEYNAKKLYVVMEKNTNNFRTNAAGLPMLVSRNFKIDIEKEMKLNLPEFCEKYGYNEETFVKGSF